MMEFIFFFDYFLFGPPPSFTPFLFTPLLKKITGELDVSNGPELFPVKLVEAALYT